MFNSENLLLVVLLGLGVVEKVSSFPNCDVRNLVCAGETILSWIQTEFESVKKTNDEFFDLNSKSIEVLKKLKEEGIGFSDNYAQLELWAQLFDDGTTAVLRALLNNNMVKTRDKVSQFIRILEKSKVILEKDMRSFINGIFFSDDALVVDRIDDVSSFMIEFGKINNQTQCGNRRSPQEVIYQVYKTLMVMEISKWCVTSYSFRVLRLLNGKGLNPFNDSFIKTEMINRMKYYHRHSLFAIQRLGTSYRHCEPTNSFAARRDFTTMGSLFRVLLLYKKVYLEKASNSTLNAVLNHQTSLHCFGRFFECSDTSTNITVCFVKNFRKEYVYHWFRDNESGRHFGLTDKCPQGVVKTFDNVDTSHDVFYNCVCVNNKLLANRSRSLKPPAIYESIYMISLDPVLSRSHENWVVMDVKLNTKCSKLYIEIDESQLEKNWVVNSSTDNSVPSKICANPSTEILGINYVEISEQEYNTINLDNVIVPSGRVITGVKFALSDGPGRPVRIELQVQSMEYDPATGKLNETSAQWTSSEDGDGEEVELDDERLDIPTRVLDPHTVVSKTGDFVRFRVSSRQKDAGQSVIPFIEYKYFSTSAQSPLTGVGLYHKRSANSAGYLAVRFFARDYSASMAKHAQ